MCPESSFDELLNLVEMNHQLSCNSEVGGCGKLNYIHHILSTPPHVFTTGINSLLIFLSFFCRGSFISQENHHVVLSFPFYFFSCSFRLAKYL